MLPTTNRHHDSKVRCAAIIASSAFLLGLIFVSMFLILTAQPAASQTSVPATARHSMQLPQFAAKLAPRSSQYRHAPQASYRPGR